MSTNIANHENTITNLYLGSMGARLVQLGVKPLVAFYHMPAKDDPHGEYIQYGWSSNALAPAFSVAELGDILPHPSSLIEIDGWIHMSECDP